MKNRIALLRAELKFSQGDLAAAVGVSRQAINAVENLRHDPSVTLAFAISRALKRPIAEVFIEDG